MPAAPLPFRFDRSSVFRLPTCRPTRLAGPRGGRLMALAAMPRRVLLTNDDGPDSPFFAPFVAHIRQQLGWDAVVCIPAAPQSFVSKSISHGPIKVHRKTQDEYHVEASPASCVNLALNHLVEDVDLVVSGPNVGHNVGRGSVLSSGTVGAAMEGALAGTRGIAISFPFFSGWNNWTTEELAAAVRVAGSVTDGLWRSWDAESGPDIYNVNVPVSVDERNHGVLFTTVDATSQYQSLYGLDTESGSYVWSPTGLRVFQVENPLPGGDVAAIKAGNVSVTPLTTGFGVGQHNGSTLKPQA